MKTGSNWYKRDPQKFTSGVIGMTAREIAVYTILIDLMYCNAGECHNSPKYVAGFIQDMGPASIRKIITKFIGNGKVILLDSGRLSNKTVQKLAKTREETNKKRTISGEKGGKKTAENRAKLNDCGGLYLALGETPGPLDKKREEEIKKKEAKASKEKRATRLSKDWFLSKELGDWSVSEGYVKEHIRFEADKFRDYWIGVGGQKGCKLDWDATWRNWIRNAKEKHNGQPNGNNQQTGMGHDPALEQIARLARLR